MITWNIGMRIEEEFQPGPNRTKKHAETCLFVRIRLKQQATKNPPVKAGFSTRSLCIQSMAPDLHPTDLKSIGRKPVPVRVWPRVPQQPPEMEALLFNIALRSLRELGVFMPVPYPPERQNSYALQLTLFCLRSTFNEVKLGGCHEGTGNWICI